MDIIGFLSGLLENKNIVFAVVGLIVVLVLLSAFPQHQSSPPEGKKECDVCSDKEVIIYFKDNNRDVREKADFCPKCGRELYKK